MFSTLKIWFVMLSEMEHPYPRDHAGYRGSSPASRDRNDINTAVT